MKITLRKANALQLAIGEAVKNISVETDVKINEFQNGEIEIARVVAEFQANLARRTQLTDAMYAIRKAVSVANSSAGVDVKLADVAQLEKRLQFYTELAAKTVREDAVVVEGKLNKLRESKDDSRRGAIYGYTNTVDTSVLTADDLKSFRTAAANAKKAKQKLQDELLEINVRTEIEVADVDLLTAEGLL
jgi:lipopolysaccharide biosynthesis regulator YciM